MPELIMPIRVPLVKTLLAAALGALLVAAPTLADTIKLKDGRAIHCDSARQQGNVVHYYIGEAALTVAADRVEKIEHDDGKGEAIGTVAGGNTGAAGMTGAGDNGGAARLAGLPAVNFAPAGNGAAAVSAATLDKLESNAKAEPQNREARAALVAALKSAAYLEYQGGNLMEAQTLLTRALGWQEQDGEAHLGLATIALAEGRYREAAEQAQRAAELEPSFTAYYQLGAAHYALEQLPAAVKAWQAAQKITDNANVRAVLEKAQRELAIAGNFTNGRTRFFNISIEGTSPDPQLEAALVNLLEESYGQLKRRFDYTPSERISAIFSTRETFRNITQAPDWAGAVNDGKLRVPVGGLAGVNDELARTITHELTHSFVFFKSRRHCPTWLNEGLAQMMEGKSSARYHAALQQLAAGGKLPSLEVLGGSFMGMSTPQAEVAYAYALAATEVLAERGVATVIAVLEDLGQNYNISVALARHTRYQNLAALEAEMRRRFAE